MQSVTMLIPLVWLSIGKQLYTTSLREQNIQTPPQKLDRTKQHQIVGAYVKEPLVGKHDWVMSFDLNSLYPHIIMQHNISPEKMIKGGARMDVNVQKMLDGDADLISTKEIK